MINRKEPELEPESQFVLSAPASEGNLISAPRLSAVGSSSTTLLEKKIRFNLSVNLAPFSSFARLCVFSEVALFKGSPLVWTRLLPGLSAVTAIVITTIAIIVIVIVITNIAIIIIIFLLLHFTVIHDKAVLVFDI